VYNLNLIKLYIMNPMDVQKLNELRRIYQAHTDNIWNQPLDQIRLRSILQQKANMGMGYHKGMNLDLEGMGVGSAGVLVRRRKKRKPSAFNIAVKAYMKKHKVSLAIASKMVSKSKRKGSKSKRKPRGKGVTVGGMKYQGMEPNMAGNYGMGKKKPSKFNKEVAKYMKKHKCTLGQAAKMVSKINKKPCGPRTRKSKATAEGRNIMTILNRDTEPDWLNDYL